MAILIGFGEFGSVFRTLRCEGGNCGLIYQKGKIHFPALSPNMNALLLTLLIIASASAYNLSSGSMNRGPLGSSSSSFAGGASSSTASAGVADSRPFIGFERGQLEMKKGKPNVPPMSKWQWRLVLG
jgi:hypothetical protein